MEDIVNTKIFNENVNEYIFIRKMIGVLIENLQLLT